MTDNFLRLLELCKCGVYLSVNSHRDYHETVDQWLENHAEDDGASKVTPLMRANMIARDTTVELQFYPQTPIGFYRVLHYDVGAAIRVALDMLNEGQEVA